MLDDIGLEHDPGEYLVGYFKSTNGNPLCLECFYMETKPETRGQRIARLRIANNMTQPALAEKLGVTKGAVSKWEGTAAPDISLGVFFKLADEFHIDPRELALGVPLKASKSTDIPPHRVGLIQKYGSLPKELRLTIRALIESLAAAQSESYSSWSREAAERAKVRDRKKPESA